MTNEALEQGKEILYQLEKAKGALESIRPYLHEVVELHVTIEKGLEGFTLNKDEKCYTLRSNDPLFLSIASALQDMIDDLQKQFDNLGVEEKTKINPLERTSLWKKIWGRKGGEE